VLLLEKNQNPNTALKSGWMGARGLNFRSTEAFYRRALLKEVKAASFGWMGDKRPGMEFKGDGSTPPPPGFGALEIAGAALSISLRFIVQVTTVPIQGIACASLNMY
jgi:hypothetical protein